MEHRSDRLGADSQTLIQARAHMMYDANKKSAGVAYLLWFFLGLFGAHRFYLGRSGSAIGQLLLGLFGFVTFFLTWIPLGLWLLIDLFLIPDIARDHNMRLANRFGGYSS